MTTKTMTVKRTSTVEEDIVVTFPIYREHFDDAYAGSVPYPRWTEISRLSEDRTKLTVKTVELQGGGDGRVTEFSITKEAISEAEFASELSPSSWEHKATAAEFHVLMGEAVRFMAETHSLDWQIGEPVFVSRDEAVEALGGDFRKASEAIEAMRCSPRIPLMPGTEKPDPSDEIDALRQFLAMADWRNRKATTEAKAVKDEAARLRKAWLNAVGGRLLWRTDLIAALAETTDMRIRLDEEAFGARLSEMVSEYGPFVASQVEEDA